MRTVRGTARAWSNLKKKKVVTKSSKMKCYSNRNTVLLSLGFQDYKAYLESEVWKEIRSKKLSRYRNCLLCECPAFEVHHMSYDLETLLGKRPFRLVQLCRTCHIKIEFDGDRKRELRETNKELTDLASKTIRGQKWLRFLDYNRNS